MFNSSFYHLLYLRNEYLMFCCFSGPVVYSTPCDLIAPCLICKGTLSITSSEMYFEVDEDDAEFKKLDSKVGLGYVASHCTQIHEHFLTF